MTRHDSLPPSPNTPQPAPLPEPIIDLEAGVERMMGNRALYLRVLARFRSDYRDAAAPIREALAAGEHNLARRLAHTIKGAAGMIDAPALHGAALALEDAVHGARDPAPLLQQLDAALAAVLRVLDGMDLTAPAAAPPTPVATGDARAQLRAMLDIGDGAALELVAAAHGELSGYLGERDYAALRVAIADFDYERALEVLDRSGRIGREAD